MWFEDMKILSLHFPNRRLYSIHPPRDFGSVLQNYEAIDRFSDSIIAETNVAHSGQVHNLGQGPDVVQRYQNYLENMLKRLETRNRPTFVMFLCCKN
jgi:deoxyadenosine/deoxycytidine kinase